MADAADFYDALALQYDLLFDDWATASAWHGGVVARVLADHGVRPPATVLDCTCGIGTQALPLARRGYAVTGTDISAAAVARARAEATRQDIAITLAVADVRDLRSVVTGSYDAVISCDNSLPHLLTDDDLAAAVTNVRACLRPRGLLLASIRDYDELARTRPAGTPVSLSGEDGSRYGAGQSWRWHDDGDYVDITLFTLTESQRGWATTAHETRYRALRRETLTTHLRDAGFSDVVWQMPDESGYYQPIVVARAPG